MIHSGPRIIITLEDASGTKSLMRLTLPNGTTVADAQVSAEALIDVIRPLTTCKVARYSVSYFSRGEGTIVPLSVLPTSPVADFYFSLTPDPDVHAVITFPLNPDWLETTGPLAGVAIDLTNADVQSLGAEVTDNGWCDPFAVDLGDLAAGMKREAP